MELFLSPVSSLEASFVKGWIQFIFKQIIWGQKQQYRHPDAPPVTATSEFH